MIEVLNQLDTRLFLLLNGIHSGSFDGIMWWISGKTTWWPFYLLLLGYLTWKRRWQMIPLLIFIALSVTMTDQVSVLMKDTFERLRPCKDPALEGMVHLVNGKCGGMYGFVSSHASNVFGVAMLLSLVVRKWWFTAVLMAWATVVSYSRIYLGVHYPGDVIGGLLLGVFCGWLAYLLFRLLIKKLPAQWKMHYPEIDA